MSGSRSVRDRGSAVPFAVACLGVVLLSGAALLGTAALVADHRAAQAAADLAALAGASAAGRGEDGCTAAAGVAAANGASLVRCWREGADLRVSVVVEGLRWLGASADLVAQARAGPA